MAAELRWYRLEISAEGKLVSCTAVERAEKNGRSWHYVQAHDPAEAGRLALNAYQMVAQRRHRAKLRAEGKCEWCGRKNDREPGKRCTRCLAKDAEYGQRKNAKAAGKPVPPLDRMVAIKARKTEEREELREEVVKEAKPSLRLEVLLEVQEAWQDATTNGIFTRWLNEQIAAARGRKVA